MDTENLQNTEAETEDQAHEEGAESEQQAGSQSEPMPPYIEEMSKAISVLAKSVQDIQQQQEELAQKILSAARPGSRSEPGEELSSSGAVKEQESEEGWPSPDELETMSRRELLDLIERKLERRVEERVGKVLQEVQSVRARTEEEKVLQEISQLEKQHPDFWEWRDEMIKIAQEMPGISPRRAYLLAKQENPKKAEELAAKYQRKDDKDEGNEGARPRFAGLTPTSGPAPAARGKLPPEKAAEAAFEEVKARFGDVFAAQE